MNSLPAIDVYTICWNEQRALPFFLRHYGPLAQKIVVFDDHSTDATREIAANHPRTEVRLFGSPGDNSGELQRLAIRQTAWRESRGRADWVIIADCDELLWHPCLPQYLHDCRERQVTIPRPTGYEMVASDFPTGSGQIYDYVRTGVRAPHMDKWLIFDPQAVESMNFEPGCHVAWPVGRCVFDDDPRLKLLHFKHMGLEYVIPRFRQLDQRRTALERRFGLNQHYTWPDEALESWLSTARGEATDVIS